MIDSSWGCDHGPYYTSASITSPSGRYSSSGYVSGTGASTSLSIDGDLGNYTITTDGYFYCSCAGTIGYGNNMTGVAADVTIGADYTFTSSYIDDVVQRKICVYAKCPYSPGDCGIGLEDAVGLPQSCAPGVHQAWLKHTFLGITYRCEEIDHQDLSSPPC